jgi:LmbE family N-acetylglucosaminyl deacetylase
VELLADRRQLVVVAPHPDDETLGCGALLHEAAQSGTRCRVICMTDGSASHRNSKTWNRERLARARKSEFEAAVFLLAPEAETIWLGYRDCCLPEAGAEATDAALRLVEQIGGDALVLTTWVGDPHVDHVRTAALVARAVKGRTDIATLAFPIWGRFQSSTVPAGLRTLCTSTEALAAKRRALACHATQMTRLIDDDPVGFVMRMENQAHFLDHPEIFHAPS